MRVADVLAAFAPPDIQPSIQSPPLGYKPRVTGPDVVESYTRQLHGVVAYLADLEAKTGRTVTLAIEPEPSCYIELTSRADRLFHAPPVFGRFGQGAREPDRRPETACEALLHRHLGAVYDICHQAVEYRDHRRVARELAQGRRTGAETAAGLGAAHPEGDAARSSRRCGRSTTRSICTRPSSATRAGYRNTSICPRRSRLGSRTSDPERVADPFPRPGLPRGRQPLQDDAPGHRGGAQGSQGKPALGPYRDRDLHVGRAAEKLKTGDIVDYVVRELEWVRDKLV